MKHVACQSLHNALHFDISSPRKKNKKPDVSIQDYPKSLPLTIIKQKIDSCTMAGKEELLLILRVDHCENLSRNLKNIKLR